MRTTRPARTGKSADVCTVFVVAVPVILRCRLPYATPAVLDRVAW
ncbi:hypothetical protein [Streptomyces sp. Ag109_O5-1]|nr:hypothetical protein [Streptomyces sp. Ag109_O5-1]